MAPSPVFLHLTQDELDRAYDQSVWAADMAGTLARYEAESARAREAVPPLTLSCGEGPFGTVDLFPAGAGAPLLFFVHGGAWRSGTRHLYSFLAPGLVARGIAVAVPDFPKIQDVALPGMTRHLADAFARVVEAAPAHGIDPGRVVIAGHSSGAHIAACLLAGAEGAAIPGRLRGACLVSGLYEMEPVLLSARRHYVALEEADRHRLSPLRHAAGLAGTRIAVFWGERESPEFVRQSRDFVAAARAAGAACEGQEIAGRDHFDILPDLAGPSGRLARTVAGLAAPA